MLPSFTCKATPALYFGAGEHRRLPSLLKQYGPRLLLVTGGRSFISGQEWPPLREDLKEQGFSIVSEQIQDEPSPEDIDAICHKYGPHTIDCVVAIGGGSVLDAGKAIAAMLVEREPVITFLEGVGSRTPSGAKVPFVAVPTTSGTGSEATSNAVISRVGENGFKKSLRHDNYIPDIALLDPCLTRSCPPSLTICCGMDTFSQLVESYLSTKASPLSDLLALEGIRCVVRSLENCCRNGRQDPAARADMCYASYLSGITLTNAGLGAVHGLASAIGGFFAIPHGVICARLMAGANWVTLRKLRKTGENQDALQKYSMLGRMTGGNLCADEEAQDLFISYLERLTSSPDLAGQGGSEFSARDVDMILANSASKNNPVQLGRDELAEILRTSWQ